MSLGCTETVVSSRIRREPPSSLLTSVPLSNLLRMEQKYMVQPSYFDTVQKEIVPHMRNLVATWMHQVCVEEERQEEVFPLAMNNLDRFLAIRNIRQSNLFSVAAAALLVASKLIEEKPFEISALAAYTSSLVTTEELLGAEIFLLSTLKWDTLAVTPVDFISPLLRQVGVESERLCDKIKRRAISFIDLTCLDDKFFIFAPSMVAAGSIAAAVARLDPRPMPHERLFTMLRDAIDADHDMLEQCYDQVRNASQPSASAYDELRNLLKTPTDVDMVD